MSEQVQQTGHTRPATMATWWLWIAASVVIPMLGMVPEVAMQRKFGPLLSGQFGVLTLAILLSLAAPAIIQWAVLRRVVPDLPLGFWLLFCWPFAVLAYVAVTWLGLGSMKAEAAFDLARYRQGQTSGAIAWAWVRVVAQAAAISFLYNFMPAVVLGWLAKRSAIKFLIFVILGACIAAVLHRYYFGFRYFGGPSLYAGLDYMRAQSSWASLATHAATLGLFGMVQGAVGGWGLMRMFPADPQGPVAQRIGAVAAAKVFGLVALALAAAHLWSYAASPRGIATRFPEIRRMLSAAPVSDISHGTPILRFAHKIALPAPTWFAEPSPDGRLIMLVTKERALRLLDVEQRSNVGAPLLAGENVRSVAWSPDGRLFAVNQPGERRGPRDHYLGRIRVFVSSGVVEIGGRSEEEQNCALSSTMAFSEDGQSIWVMCERAQGRPSDLLAVRLQVPGLQVVERRPGPAVIAGKGFTHFADLMPRGATAVASFTEHAGEARYLFVLDVMKDELLFASRNVATAELGGSGFGFCGLHLSRDAKLLTMANCALPAHPTKVVYQPRGQFRTFDTATGDLVAAVGTQAPGEDVIQWSLAFDRAHDRLVGIGSTQASKRGTLVVWDQRTGEELQRIETHAFRAGKFSLDGRSLSLLGRDDDALYVYRAE